MKSEVVAVNLLVPLAEEKFAQLDYASLIEILPDSLNRSSVKFFI